MSAPARPGHEIWAATRHAAEVMDRNKGLSVVLYFSWVFVKVLAASHGNLTTALGVLGASSLPAIVAGATLATLPLLVLDLLALIVFLALSGHWRGRWLPTGTDRRSRVSRFVDRNGWLLAVTVVLLAAAALLPSVVLMAAALVTAVVSGLLVSLGWVRIKTGIVVLTTGLLLVNVPQVIKTVWQPHEVLYAKDGRTVLDVGYVLDDSDERIVVLRTHARDLHIIAADRVGRREYCTVGDAFAGIDFPSLSLWQEISHSVKDPTCPPAPHSDG